MKTSLLISLLLFSFCSQGNKAESNFAVKQSTPENLNVNAVSVSTKKTNSAAIDSSIHQIKSSKLSARLTAIKAEKPQISDAELADYANNLLPKYGVNFWVDLADLIDKKSKSNQLTKLDDENVRFNFPATLTDGRRETFQIDSPTDSCCCGYAYADFPVTQITPRQMKVIVDEKPYIIKRSKDISFSQEHILLDNKNKSKKIRSWQMPSETYPFGISEDGTKLYTEDEETGLLLEINEKGNIKFVPKNASNIIIDKQDLRESPAPKLGEIIYKSGEDGLMLFKSGDKNFIISFPYPCT